MSDYIYILLKRDTIDVNPRRTGYTMRHTHVYPSYLIRIIVLRLHGDTLFVWADC